MNNNTNGGDNWVIQTADGSNNTAKKLKKKSTALIIILICAVVLLLAVFLPMVFANQAQQQAYVDSQKVKEVVTAINTFNVLYPDNPITDVSTESIALLKESPLSLWPMGITYDEEKKALERIEFNNGIAIAKP